MVPVSRDPRQNIGEFDKSKDTTIKNVYEYYRIL